MHALPSNSVSVVSEIARATFPAGSPGSVFYYLVQGLTFAILVLAANTSYQGFPRLSAILARDRYFPRQFVNLGDRLVYSNGIVVLAGIASLLIWAFKADVNSLIHLYVIGVFTAFTLSQTGMVRYWSAPQTPGLAQVPRPERRGRDRNDAGRAARRRDEVPRGRVGGRSRDPTARRRLLRDQPPLPEGRRAASGPGSRRSQQRHRRRTSVVLYVESYDAALREAVWYAQQIAGDDFRAIHVPGPHTDTGIRPRFRQLTGHAPRPGDRRSRKEAAWTLSSTTSGDSPAASRASSRSIIPEEFRRPSLLDAAPPPDRVLAEAAPAEASRA